MRAVMPAEQVKSSVALDQFVGAAQAEIEW